MTIVSTFAIPARTENKTTLLLADIAQAFAPLQGTEKQIAWAEKIRAECPEKVQTAIFTVAQTLKGGHTPENLDVLSTMIETAFAIASQSDASFWINTRDILYSDFAAREVSSK